MPAFAGMTAAEATELIRFLRTLRPREGSGPTRAKLALATGGTLDGLVLNESSADLQLLGDDRQIHLLRKEGARYRAVTSQVDWPSYDGIAEWQPLQHAQTDRQGQRVADGAQVDLQPAATRRTFR